MTALDFLKHFPNSVIQTFDDNKDRKNPRFNAIRQVRDVVSEGLTKLESFNKDK